MPALLHLTWLRLAEQPAKMLYLVIVLAMVVLAWLVLSTFASPSLAPNSKTIEARIVVLNGRAQNTIFPLRYIPRLQQVPGVDDMHWFTAAAFFCGDGSGTTVTIYGGDGQYDDELRKKGASETDLATWRTTENGVLVGAKTAEQCGLPAGTTVSPRNLYGTGEIPLHVIAVLPEQGGKNDLGVHAHYHYVNRMMAGKLGDAERDAVVWAIVNVKDPSQLDRIAGAIEQEFQSFDPPLEARVAVEADSLLGRFGQVQALLALIMGALALCVLLVFVAITIHLVAQRRGSMAILHTLGFNAKIQFFGLILELTSVILTGAVLGVTAGYAALAWLTPWAVDTLFSHALRPANGAVLVLLPALLVLLISTLAWPAVQLAKLKPIDYLRV